MWFYPYFALPLVMIRHFQVSSNKGTMYLSTRGNSLTHITYYLLYMLTETLSCPIYTFIILELRRRYAVVGRLKKGHSAYDLTTRQMVQQIAHELKTPCKCDGHYTCATKLHH